jgi:hypothetical protein
VEGWGFCELSLLLGFLLGSCLVLSSLPFSGLSLDLGQILVGGDTS